MVAGKRLAATIAACFLAGSLERAALAATYKLSGSLDGTAIFLVDDDLDVYRNDVVIFTENVPPGTPRDHLPIVFAAEIGDRVRIRVRDTYGICSLLSPVYLTDPLGNGMLADQGFDVGCGRPAGDLGVTHDLTFVIPDLTIPAAPIFSALLPSPTLAGVVSRGSKLYGTTYEGGAFDKGTVFEATSNLFSVGILHSFSTSEGTTPYSEPTAGVGNGAGFLFGTTFSGGLGGSGTIYKLNLQTGELTVLHHFAGAAGSPRGPLVQIGDVLYGSAGSYPTESTVFRIGINGTGFSTVRALSSAEGYLPGAMTLGSDGFLYGTATYGGDLDCDLPNQPYGCGTIFRVRPDGTDFAVLHTFDHATPAAANPNRKLAIGADGMLHGTTLRGAFRLSSTPGAGDLQFVYTVPPGGDQIFAPPILGSDGRLYLNQYDGGAAAAGSVVAMNTDGTNVTTLHEFDFEPDQGGYGPYGILHQAANGRLYGTTEYTVPPPNSAVLFQLQPNPSVLFAEDFESGGLTAWSVRDP